MKLAFRAEDHECGLGGAVFDTTRPSIASIPNTYKLAAEEQHSLQNLVQPAVSVLFAIPASTYSAALGHLVASRLIDSSARLQPAQTANLFSLFPTGVESRFESLETAPDPGMEEDITAADFLAAETQSMADTESAVDTTSIASPDTPSPTPTISIADDEFMTKFAEDLIFKVQGWRFKAVKATGSHLGFLLAAGGGKINGKTAEVILEAVSTRLEELLRARDAEESAKPEWSNNLANGLGEYTEKLAKRAKHSHDSVI